MSKIRLEKLRRLTLPPEIIAQAGLHQDDVLEATYANGEIILRPTPLLALSTDGQSMMDYAGACKSAWGDTPAEVEFHMAARFSTMPRACVRKIACGLLMPFMSPQRHRLPASFSLPMTRR